MIHTSLSPNTEEDDVTLALYTLLRPWLWRDYGVITKVQEKLSEITQMPYVSTVDSGRTALATLLDAFNIGEGDEVILQAYTCLAVPNPVMWVGAKPVYIDCTDNLVMDVDDLREKITSNTKAIVVQHTFGMPAPLTEIIAVAKEHNILVIEDCAHALGGEYKGQPLGSWGDASFFSFGRDKCISSVFGGAIAVRDIELHKKISNKVRSYPLPSSLWVMRQLLHPPVLTVAKATYNTFGIGKIILEISKRLKVISKVFESPELRARAPSFTYHQYSPALARLLQKQLSKLDKFVEHRRQCVRCYQEALNSMEEVRVPEFIDGHAYLRYTVFSDKSAEYFAEAREQGIELGNWYTTVIAPAWADPTVVGYEYGSCPRAERLAKQSINVPTHIGITKDDIKTIVKHVFH